MFILLLIIDHLRSWVLANTTDNGLSSNSQWPNLKDQQILGESSHTSWGFNGSGMLISRAGCLLELGWLVFYFWCFSFSSYPRFVVWRVFLDRCWFWILKSLVSSIALKKVKLQAASRASRRQGDAALGLHLFYPCRHAKVQGSPVRGTRDTRKNHGELKQSNGKIWRLKWETSVLKMDQQQLQSVKKNKLFLSKE